MPVYEYSCIKCKTITEALQPMSAKKIMRCKKCDSWMKRIISKIGGFIFKGPGFYATDYQGK